MKRMSGETRIPALDGLRGTAIILVMVHHFVALPQNETLINHKIHDLAYAGWIGVDLFFVLSGFLITGILAQAKEEDHYFRNFYMRRILRIFPLYYGVLLVLFGLVPLVYQYSPAVQKVADRQAWLWFYGVNLNIALESQWLFGAEWLELGHFWSLAVEEHFYFLWPALVFVLRRRVLMMFCGLCIPVALVARVALLKAGVEPTVVFVLTFCRMDSLAIGGLLALALRSPRGVDALLPAARWASAASGAALLTIFLIYGNFSEELPVMQSVGYPLLALFFGSLLVLSLDPAPTSMVRRVFSFRFLRLFGVYSYGLYVFHVLLRPLFIKLFGVPRLVALLPSPLGAVIAFTILAILGSLLVAILSWHLYERPFLKLKRFFEYRRAQDPSEATIEGQIRLRTVTVTKD